MSVLHVFIGLARDFGWIELGLLLKEFKSAPLPLHLFAFGASWRILVESLVSLWTTDLCRNWRIPQDKEQKLWCHENWRLYKHIWWTGKFQPKFHLGQDNHVLKRDISPRVNDSRAIEWDSIRGSLKGNPFNSIRDMSWAWRQKEGGVCMDEMNGLCHLDARQVVFAVWDGLTGFTVDGVHFLSFLEKHTEPHMKTFRKIKPNQTKRDV